jgi:formate dehydrogenase beta subunit
MAVDRRRFLKMLGVGMGGALLTGQEALASRSLAAEDDVTLLYDTTKCIGCRACQNACKQLYGNPAEPDPTGLYDAPQHLSADTWTLIKVRTEGPNADWPFFNYQCMHCTDAACVAVCPTGALHQDELGFVALDRSLCIGCGYCTQFCPYGVPHLGNANLYTGEAKSFKCFFCQARVRSGVAGPACAEACPTEALIWGNRGQLLQGAKERVTDLKVQGVNEARLYGEKEAGGLRRLSILVDRPSAYGLPDDPQGSITFANAWRKIIQPLGSIAFGATVAGVTGAFLLIRRNIRMEEVE